jgi:hypothetical protein
MQPPEAATQETPDKALPLAPDGFRVGWIDQVVPFQASARVPSELVTALPTAAQAVEEMHETPDREADVAPDGFGVAWIDQVVPFQVSASVTVVPALFT